MDTKIEKKKGLRPKTMLLIFSGMGLLALTLWLISTSGTSTIRVQAERISVASVVKGEFKDYISLVGTVAPISTILLDVEEGGKVIEKVAQEGQMLGKGDIIVHLENNDLNLQILNSESNLAYQSNELRNTMINMERQKISNKQQLLSIDNQLKLLKRVYERNVDLFALHHISQEDFLISKDNYDLALAERELRYEQMIQDSIFRENQHLQMNISLKNMEQNLKVVRQRLEKLNIQAPVDGQLGSLTIEIGQLINRGERIGQIHVLEDYKISADIDEHYIDRVRHELRATFERQNSSYELVVSRVYPEVRNGRFQVDFRFAGEKPENLRTGQTYHISLELGQSLESTLIPRGGFFQSTGGQWVFVLSGNTAMKRNIRIGRQNPQFYEVLEGLEPGEKIITNSYDLFGNSDVVVISN
jgi:HlyD family secretion protein